MGYIIADLVHFCLLHASTTDMMKATFSEHVYLALHWFNTLPSSDVDNDIFRLCGDHSLTKNLARYQVPRRMSAFWPYKVHEPRRVVKSSDWSIDIRREVCSRK